MRSNHQGLTIGATIIANLIDSDAAESFWGMEYVSVPVIKEDYATDPEAPVNDAKDACGARGVRFAGYAWSPPRKGPYAHWTLVVFYGKNDMPTPWRISDDQFTLEGVWSVLPHYQLDGEPFAMRPLKRKANEDTKYVIRHPLRDDKIYTVGEDLEDYCR